MPTSFFMHKKRPPPSLDSLFRKIIHHTALLSRSSAMLLFFACLKNVKVILKLLLYHIINNHKIPVLSGNLFDNT